MKEIRSMKMMKAKMKNWLKMIVPAVAACAAQIAMVAGTDDQIWFDTPAGTFGDDWAITQDVPAQKKGWEWEGLPVGNGRVGAMALESAARERLQLNEISLWTGGENAGGNGAGYAYGPTTGRGGFGSYQPFANWLAKFDKIDGATDFRRELNLSNGVAGTEFKSHGVKFSRKVFAAGETNAIVAVYTASKKGALTGTFALTPEHTAKVSANKNGTIALAGTLANGMKFAAKAQIFVSGGKISTTGTNGEVRVNYEGNGDAAHAVFDGNKVPKLRVEGADKIVVAIAMHTDYVMNPKKNWVGGDPVPAADATLKSLAGTLNGKDFIAELTKTTTKLFRRVKLDLGKTDKETAALPTPKRLEKYAGTKRDPELEATMFSFGRYCLLSSSRGSLPANLQGIWNDKVHAPWASDYHNNINIQEAYWPAETTNLSECAQPLINYLKATEDASTASTKIQFKNKTGWTCRISQNPWGAGGWSMWNNVGSAWYCLHLWEHYEFSRDKKYLKETAYPMMKNVCGFWEEMLKTLEKGGKNFATSEKGADLKQLANLPAGMLVAPNGWSHEWGPTEDGVAHDQQLIRNLFINTIKAAEILGGNEKKYAEQLKKKLAKLVPDKISPNGYLQEWMIDRPNMVSGHRHTSHLFAVFPGSEISFEKTPELAAAAKKSLEMRGLAGDSRRSWSWPWRAALWARFKEGDKAHEMIEGLLIHNTLPNLLTTHTPFQMDGNFALPAAIAEMFVQSQTGAIVLLPAPCKAWPKGRVRGLKARGNVTVGFEWENGKVKKYSLTSPIAQTVTVIVNGKTKQEKIVPAEKK